MMEDEEPLLFWGARRNAEDAIRKQMPTNHSILLHRLAERCPRLHTLSIQGFDHPHCDLSDQDNWRSAISTLLPDALPCLRRLHLSSAFQFDGSRARNQTPLVLVPLLERTRIDQLDMTLGAVTTAGLLTAAAESSRRLLQISVSDLAPASVLLLCEVCTGLRRLRLTRCDLGVEQRAAPEPPVRRGPRSDRRLATLPGTVRLPELEYAHTARLLPAPLRGNSSATRR